MKMRFLAVSLYLFQFLSRLSLLYLYMLCTTHKYFNGCCYHFLQKKHNQKQIQGKIESYPNPVSTYLALSLISACLTRIRSNYFVVVNGVQNTGMTFKILKNLQILFVRRYFLFWISFGVLKPLNSAPLSIPQVAQA